MLGAPGCSPVSTPLIRHCSQTKSYTVYKIMSSTKYHAKQFELYYLTEVLRWELYNSSPNMFRDLVHNSALFDVKLILSRSR